MRAASLDQVIVRDARYAGRFLAIFPDLPLWMVLEDALEPAVREATADLYEFHSRAAGPERDLAEALLAEVERNGEPVESVSANPGRRSVAVFDITNACSLQCVHCSHSAIPVAAGGKQFMDPRLVTKLLEDLGPGPGSNGPNDARGLHMVHIVGGEPLLHPQIEEIFDRVAAAGYAPTFISNFVDLDANRGFLEKLSSNPYYFEASVSLDGHNDRVNAITRGAGSYERTAQNLRVLRELGIPFSLNPLIHSQNREFLADILEHFMTLGCREINVLALKAVGRARAGKRAPEVVEQMDIYADLVQLCGERPEFLPYLKHTRFWYVLGDLISSKKRLSCGLHNPSTPYITASGDVYLCGYMLFAEHRLVNAWESDVRAAMESSQTREAGEAFLVNEMESRDCYLRHLCACGCRAEVIGGGLCRDAIHPRCEQIKSALHRLMFVCAEHPEVVEWAAERESS